MAFDNMFALVVLLVLSTAAPAIEGFDDEPLRPTRKAQKRVVVESDSTVYVPTTIPGLVAFEFAPKTSPLNSDNSYGYTRGWKVKDSARRRPGSVKAIMAKEKLIENEGLDNEPVQRRRIKKRVESEPEVDKITSIPGLVAFDFGTKTSPINNDNSYGYIRRSEVKGAAVALRRSHGSEKAMPKQKSTRQKLIENYGLANKPVQRRRARKLIESGPKVDITSIPGLVAFDFDTINSANIRGSEVEDSAQRNKFRSGKAKKKLNILKMIETENNRRKRSPTKSENRERKYDPAIPDEIREGIEAFLKEQNKNERPNSSYKQFQY